jgi:transposase InsO family protein
MPATRPRWVSAKPGSSREMLTSCPCFAFASAAVTYRTVRHDWLAHHLFETLDEIREFATRWLWTYNQDRPNMALGGITPQQKLALAA